MVREGSVYSNHPELMQKTSTHLAISALKWFEKVRGGLLRLNHPEVVYRYPTHLVPPVKMRFEKVRYSRTTPKTAIEGNRVATSCSSAQSVPGHVPFPAFTRAVTITWQPFTCC